MKKLLRDERGVAVLILVLVMLSTLLFASPTIAVADGIDQPDDGLNSITPPEGGANSPSAESLVLFAVLSLVL